jgi:hypothetical protein
MPSSGLIRLAGIEWLQSGRPDREVLFPAPSVGPDTKFSEKPELDAE